MAGTNRQPPKRQKTDNKPPTARIKRRMARRGVRWHERAPAYQSTDQENATPSTQNATSSTHNQTSTAFSNPRTPQILPQILLSKSLETQTPTLTRQPEAKRASRLSDETHGINSSKDIDDRFETTFNDDIDFANFDFGPVFAEEMDLTVMPGGGTDVGAISGRGADHGEVSDSRTILSTRLGNSEELGDQSGTLSGSRSVGGADNGNETSGIQDESGEHAHGAEPRTEEC